MWQKALWRSVFIRRPCIVIHILLIPAHRLIKLSFNIARRTIASSIHASTSTTSWVTLTSIVLVVITVLASPSIHPTLITPTIIPSTFLLRSSPAIVLLQLLRLAPFPIATTTNSSSIRPFPPPPIHRPLQYPSRPMPRLMFRLDMLIRIQRMRRESHTRSFLGQLAERRFPIWAVAAGGRWRYAYFAWIWVMG